VPLKSGGYLVINQTEALVAVDVNSGKTTGDNQEDTAFKTNMEAAEEVARQLRMRDLAGLVAIDFIDMKRESHIRQVQDRLVECLREDKARMEVGKINRFGVLVLTRQRIRPSISHATHETCPMCQGSGKVKNLDTLVLSVVRRLKAILSRGGVAEIRVKLAPAIAMGVLNAKRRDLAEMEAAAEAKVTILADPEVAYGEMAAEIERREEEPQEKPAPRMEPRRSSVEDDTVVLGGDSPISFDRALSEDARKVSAPAGFKYDRRDLQRAVLAERDRLRALFESAKPEDELEPAEAAEPSEPKPEKEKKGRRRRRGRGGDRAAEATPAVEAAVTTPAVEPVAETPRPAPVADATPVARPASRAKATPRPQPAPQVEPAPAPVAVVLDAAALLDPVVRPKRMAPASAPAVEEAPKAPAKRARKPKAEAPAPAPEAPAPEAPAPKRARKPKAVEESPAAPEPKAKARPKAGGKKQA